MNLEHYSPAPDLPPTDLRGPADRGGGASPVRGSTEPFTALGLASEFVPDQEEQGLDPPATPTLGEEWAHHGFCVRDLDLLGS